MLRHLETTQFKDGIVDGKDASAVAAGFRDSTDVIFSGRALHTIH